MDTIFSDVDSLSESCSSEDYEDIESLYSGHALNIFSRLEETISKIDDLLMFERGFVLGDIVSLFSDPLGPMGKVVQISLTVDLEDVYGHKIRDVSSKYLQKLRSVSVGDYVVCEAYIGKVEKIIDHLTILFDDGTKDQLSLDGPEKIISLSPDVLEDPNYPYYPGQRVLVEYPSLSKSSIWLCGNDDNNSKELGTICNVDAGLVYVDWLYCAGAQRTAPSSLQELKDLTLLPAFSCANWQLGDWCVLQVDQDSLGIPSIIGREQQHMTTQSMDIGCDIQQIAVIIKTKAKVDVQWQDGSKSLGLDSCLVSPVNVVDAHDFWPDTFVLETGTVDDSKVNGSQRWGIVKSVDPKERTVKVKWCESCPDSSVSEGKVAEEIVSAYELIEHPDYNCLGQTIRRTENNVGIADQNYMKHQSKSNIYMEGDNLKVLVDGKDQFLSYFGTVVGIAQGSLEVKWANGDVTKVQPSEICIVDRCEDASAPVTLAVQNFQPTDIVSNDNVKTQMVDNENPPSRDQSLGKKLKDIFGLNCDRANEYISQAAVGFLTNMTSSLFGSLGASHAGRYECTAEDARNPSKLPHEEVALGNLNDGDELLNGNDHYMPEEYVQETKEVNEDVKDISTHVIPKSFKQFDILGHCPDHHFADESGMDLQSPQTKRCWLRKVHQEWSILEKDLPETIYVRVYEEKMQLIRAAIVGPAGTPYHDLLFFFDIYLPPQYPNEPPMVYYNSGGLRINPNLYESGRVCLSLLNTWAGSQCEVWNPESSTILQVLVSIQGLVLNDKPYFNEAGFDSQIGKPDGEKNSLSYNENVFLVSCKSMLYLLRKPPQQFEELVDEHFNRCGRDILMACKDYMQGAPIGCQFNSKNMEHEVHQRGNSKGFKIMLGKIFPELVEAFFDKGVDCGDFLDEVS